MVVGEGEICCSKRNFPSLIKSDLEMRVCLNQVHHDEDLIEHIHFYIP